MSKVQILDDVVVNQIAAGEVVERPASVVKELVENSIDAGSTEISVAITNGGKTSLEVQDNGCGMTREDALVAIQRFGTSKIRASQDLESIATLGFRGEALPSIASISRFSLTTSPGDDEQGTYISIEGGVSQHVETVSAPKGTRIQIKSLFFNVPARKKFLRTDATESGQVKALINDFALAYPQIRFSLSIDTVQSLNYPQVDGYLSRISQVRIAGSSPVEVNEQFVADGKEIRITGVISSPIDSVGTASKLRLLVNGRSVRDKVLLKAIRDGYGTFLRPGRHPSGVIFLSMPPQEVDVNVHPQKTEVRFRNPGEVFRAVLLSVSRSLSKSDHSSGFEADSAAVSEISEAKERLQTVFSANSSGSNVFDSVSSSGVSAFTDRRENSDEAVEVSFFAGDTNAQRVPFTAQLGGDLQSKRFGSMPDVKPLQSMRYVGQIFSLYLLFEGESQQGGSFGMLDMHAAHERVVFYRLKEQLNANSMQTQQLLIPIEVELSPEEQAHITDGNEILERLGFSTEIDASKLKIKSVPAVLIDAPIQRIIRDLVEIEELASWERFVETELDHVLSRMACHGSVRSGRGLKEPEVEALLSSLVQADASGLCPHGRPVVRYFSEYQLEQFFGRA